MSRGGPLDLLQGLAIAAPWGLVSWHAVERAEPLSGLAFGLAQLACAVIALGSILLAARGEFWVLVAFALSSGAGIAAGLAWWIAGLAGAGADGRWLALSIAALCMPVATFVVAAYAAGGSGPREGMPRP